MTSTSWALLPKSAGKIDLSTVLAAGQSFTWRKLSNDVWCGVINDVGYLLRSSSRGVMHCRIRPSSCCRLPSKTFVVTKTPSSNFQCDDVSIGSFGIVNAERKRPDRTTTSSVDSKKLKFQNKTTLGVVDTTKLLSSTKRRSIKSEPINTTYCRDIKLEHVTTSEVHAVKLERSSVNDKSSVSKLNSDNVEKCGQSVKLERSCLDIPESDIAEEEDWALFEYLGLENDMELLTAQWQTNDPLFVTRPGIRVLRQAPLETLIAFICSSQNNITRISSMVRCISERYGHHISCLPAATGGCLYSFPQLDDLSRVSDLEATLRANAFGYRAGYIARTVAQLTELGGESWLMKLRQQPTTLVLEELQKLTGVGPKVADCVALYCLNQFSVVPIDTHILQLARDVYRVPCLEGKKSITNSHYRIVTKYFRTLWGEKAGVAQAVLFAARVSK